MRTAFHLLFVVLALGIAAQAAAQPPGWMLDNPYMPHRGRIGVRVQPMTPELRKFFATPSDRGVLVSEVQPDRPAAAAGLQVGDVIVSGGDEVIRAPYDLVKTVARIPAGEKLALTIVRGGAEVELEIEPDGDPVPWADAEGWREWFDQRMREGGEQLRERLHELEDRLEELERRFEKNSGSQQTGFDPTHPVNGSAAMPVQDRRGSRSGSGVPRIPTG